MSNETVHRLPYEWSRAALNKLLLVLVGALLTACVSPVRPSSPDFGPLEPFPCERFGESRWQEFQFGVGLPDDVIATVTELWGFDRDQLRINLRSDLDPPYIGIGWSDSVETGLGAAYSTNFRDGHRYLRRIVLEWNLPEPALTQIIDCLGPPEYYSAAYVSGTESTGVGLDLWYVEKGFVARGLVDAYFPWQTLPEVITPDFRMDLFLVLPPGLEKMAYSLRNSVEGANREMCVLKPWPGSIEAIEIDEIEDIQFELCDASASD